MSKEEGSIFRFVFGMFSGIISGIVLGLLVAPKPGKEMREELSHKSKELKEFTKGRFEEFQQNKQGKSS